VVESDGAAAVTAVDILAPLRNLGLDDHEAVVAVQAAAGWDGVRPSASAQRTFELVKGTEVCGHYALNSRLSLKSFELRNDLWSEVFRVISEDVSINTRKVLATTVFAIRPLTGYTRVDSWIQIRPTTDPISIRTRYPQLPPHVPGLGYPLPFMLEVSCRHSSLPLLASYWQVRDIREALWLMTAFLADPIFLDRRTCAYVGLDDGVTLVNTLNPNGPTAHGDSFSDTSDLEELLPAPHEEYYAALGINENSIRVPDLRMLYSRYKGLSREDQLRFVRACAFLSEAAEPDQRPGRRLLACVGAIEALLEKAEQCNRCCSHVGITANFKEFIADFVRPSDDIADLYNSLYTKRSKLAHGSWHYEVDEPFLGLHHNAFCTELAAWDGAKRGIINWLLSRQRH
jgi:hypothetical protein